MAYVTKSDHNMANFKCSHPSNCIPQETSIRDVRLAAAYVPYQKFCTMLSPIESLMKGTVFPELYSPYDGKDKKPIATKGCKREDEI